MPLLIPGLTSASTSTSNDGKSTEDWQSKLLGKKIGESSDNLTFAKKELPKETRVINEGDMVSKDFNKDRLNVHLASDGTVRHVDYQ